MPIVESELLQAAHIELVEELHKAGKDGSIRLKFCKTPKWHKTYSNQKNRVLGVWEGHRGKGPPTDGTGFWMPLPAKYA